MKNILFSLIAASIFLCTAAATFADGLHNDINPNTPCWNLGGTCTIGSGQSVCGNGQLLYSGGWCGSGKVCCYGRFTGGPNGITNSTPCWDVGSTFTNGTGWCTPAGTTTCGSSFQVYGTGGWCGANQVCCDPVPDCNAGPSESACQWKGTANTCGPTSGSQTITYNSYAPPDGVGGAISCNKTTKVVDCDPGTDHCNSGNTCVTGACVGTTQAPTAVPTSSGPVPTTGSVAIHLEGIGLAEGDNPNPKHFDRYIILYFYPPTDTSFAQPAQAFQGKISYNPATGNFSNAAFPLPGLVAGKYLVLVRSLQGSLISQIGTGDGTGPITIVTTGGANLLVDTQNSSDTNAATTVPVLQMGDIIPSDTSFNFVDTLDWNIVKDCFSSTTTNLTSNCSAHANMIDTTTKVLLPDLNDDGVVDGIDYTMLMGNYNHYGIGQSSLNRGNDPSK